MRAASLVWTFVLLAGSFAIATATPLADLDGWQPPASFALRDAPLPAERPEAGTPFIFAVLVDELFGSNRDKDPPVGVDVKHAEFVAAYYLNVGRANWTGAVTLDIVEAGIRVETNVTDLVPFKIKVLQWVGYLDLDGTAVTAQAAAWEQGERRDEYVKTGSYQREWPTEFPLGLFVRDLDLPRETPPWFPGTPYAVSFLSTQPLGNMHTQRCDDTGCRDNPGISYFGYFRWVAFSEVVTGTTCLRGHHDMLGPAVWPHDEWDDEECFEAWTPPPEAPADLGPEPGPPASPSGEFEGLPSADAPGASVGSEDASGRATPGPALGAAALGIALVALLRRRQLRPPF